MAIRYKNSPIKEAILECLAPTRQWTPALAEEILKAAGVPANAEFEVIVDKQVRILPADIVHTVETQRIRAWFNERTHMYQAGANLCAVNMMPPYTSFDDMAPMFQSLVSAFEQRAGAGNVERLGQRYINEIVVARNDATPNLNFTIAPSFRSDAPVPFQIQWEAAKTSALTIQAGLAVTKMDDATVTYVFDLYAMSEPFIAPTVTQLVDWQASAHAVLFDIFDATLTERLRAQLGRTNDV